MKIDFNKRAYRYLLLAAVLVLTVGTIFYHYTEHWNWINAYYFSVVTLATVGYGDLTPKTDAGKLFTTFYILVGVGIIATFLNYSLRRRADKISRRHNDSE